MLGLGLLLLTGVQQVAADGLVPRFVTDPLTGVALDGFDPVSYFTNSDPLAGMPDFEYDWAGVPWYFSNPANRDVFIHAPETYAPQFGGHATMALAKGYLSDGSPQIYLVVADRLYLFYSAAKRDAFEADPATAIGEARAKWQEFSKNMTPLPATAPKPVLAPAPSEPPGLGPANVAPAHPPAASDPRQPASPAPAAQPPAGK